MTELLRWRNRYGVQQADLARLLGVSRSTVMRYEETEEMSTILRMALLGILFKHPPDICPCYGCQEARFKADPEGTKEPCRDLRSMREHRKDKKSTEETASTATSSPES